MNVLVYCLGVLLALAASPGAELAKGQRPPCWNCDAFRNRPMPQMRSHCTYPCECGAEEPECEGGVSPVRDGCGCCPVCPRQLAQPCDKTSVCDEHHALFCHYPYVGADVGICQGRIGLSCTVGNQTYRHGETFHVDCRNQCTCQNGTYACSSLCPNENISPRAACQHPRLVDVPGQCCREWMCDSTEAELPPSCKEESTSWTRCSSLCGLGTSHRTSNVNGCVVMNETRICQLRPCQAAMLDTPYIGQHHHIRKGHECKATQRVAGPVRLRFGSCRSKKRFRPRYCGHCADRAYDSTCCTPQLSTTIKVDFVCESTLETDALDDWLEVGRDLWWPDDLMAIHLITNTESNLSQNDNDTQLESSISADTNPQRIANDVSITAADHWLTGDQSSNEADVFHLDKPLRISTTSEASDTTTLETTTSKPRRKRKKPRKPYTSWLEFRDEEYQMDEYEDYDDVEKRSKRSAPHEKETEPRGKVRRDLEKLRQYSRTVGLQKSRRNSTVSTKARFQSLSEIPKLPKSKIKSVKDFKMYKTIKSHIRKPKPPAKPSMMESRRKWREREKARQKEEREKQQAKQLGKQRKGKNNRLSKMERIIKGKGGNITRSWWSDKNPADESSQPDNLAWTSNKVSTSAVPGLYGKRRKKREAGPVKSARKPKKRRLTVGKNVVDFTVRHKRSSAERGLHQNDLGGFRSRKREDESFNGVEKYKDTLGRRSVQLNVQWIVKCGCDRSCAHVTTTPSELSAEGEVVLRRVHRTAPP